MKYSAISNFRGWLSRMMHSSHYTGNGRLFLDGSVKIKTGKGSSFRLNNNMFFGYNGCGFKSNQTYIRLDEKAKFISNGNARIFYGGDVYLFENAVFEIGDSYINSNCNIRVTKRIKIGDGCAISCGFTAFDNNFHWINGAVKQEEIIIEDNVWIGSGVTILPGVVIGKGSVIAAGAVVNKSIPPHSLAAGIPAAVIKKEIEWRM